MGTPKTAARARRFGAFILGTDRLTLDGRAVPLALKPLAVLNTLVDRAGAVVAKDEIAEGAWGPRPVSDESVSRTVFLVRQALGDNDSDRPRYVETVHGRGYRFISAVRIDERSRPAARMDARPDDPREREARDLCLAARTHLARGLTRIREALALLERAVATCPAYAPALAGLGECHFYTASGGVLPPRVAAERARVFLEDAVQLAPDDGRARACLGILHGAFLHDLATAEAEFERALACDPADPIVHWGRGMHRLSLARFDEACECLDAAVQLEPANATVQLHRNIALHCAGDDEGAYTRLRDLARFEPANDAVAMTQALLAAVTGRVDEAVAIAERLIAAPDAHPQLRPIAGFALARAGRRERALEQLDALDREVAGGRFVMPTFVAMLALELGDRRRALDMLNEAVDAPCPWASFVPVLPPLAALRGDPEFAVICGRLGRADVLAMLQGMRL